MKPVSPVIPGENLDEIKCAEDQPEYMTLPIIVLGNGNVLSRWTMDEAEKQIVGVTGELYIYLRTFGYGPPECLFQVDNPTVADSEEFITKGKTAYPSTDLPVLHVDGEGMWLLLQLTDEDREIVKRDGNVYFFMNTGGGPVTPSMIQVEKPPVDGIDVEFIVGVRATEQNEQLAARHNIKTFRSSCVICAHVCLVSDDMIPTITDNNLKIICSVCSKDGSPKYCFYPETVQKLRQIIHDGKDSLN